MSKHSYLLIPTSSWAISCNPRAPYKNTPTEIPGVLEAEHFDSGAQGIAYYDTNSSKEGTGASYRSDAGGVDIEKGGTGYVLGYTQVGEWVEYTLNVKKAGIYSVDMSYSAPEDGAAFNLSLKTADGLKSLTAEKVVVPNTGAWGTFLTHHSRCLIPLEEGTQTIRLTIADGPNYVMNIDKMTFEQVNVDENIGIELTSDDEEAMVGLETTVNANVTSAKAVKSVKFYVDGIFASEATEVPFKYTFTPSAKGQLNITAYAIDADGSESKIAARTVTVSPLRLVFNGEKKAPCVIEAEDFDMGSEGMTYHDSDSKDDFSCGYRKDNEGVDIKKTASGVYCISNTAVGEWLEYSVNLTQEGKYTFTAVLSSTAAKGGMIKISQIDGTKVTEMTTLKVAQTGSDVWKTATTRNKRTLAKGKTIFRIEITDGSLDIDKFEIICTDPVGIDDISVDNPSESGRAYSITGQRVGENYRGVIIKNGKKFLKK